MNEKILNDFDAVIWDYDGVILDSNDVRELGFRQCLKSFPKDHVESLIDYHNVNGGLSRFHKFRYFFEVIRGENVSDSKINSLCTEFSEIMRGELTNTSRLFGTALELIQSNKKSERKQFVASGSEQNELRYLLTEQGLSHYFDGIYGSPTPKSEIVSMILKENLEENRWCLIGDSINDLDAARENNIFFIGVRNEHLQTRADFYEHNW